MASQWTKFLCSTFFCLLVGTALAEQSISNSNLFRIESVEVNGQQLEYNLGSERENHGLFCCRGKGSSRRFQVRGAFSPSALELIKAMALDDPDLLMN
jgi:hypothetical protein